MNRRRSLLTALFLALTLVLTACGDDGSEVTAGSGSSEGAPTDDGADEPAVDPDDSSDVSAPNEPVEPAPTPVEPEPEPQPSEPVDPVPAELEPTEPVDPPTPVDPEPEPDAPRPPEPETEPTEPTEPVDPTPPPAPVDPPSIDEDVITDFAPVDGQITVPDSAALNPSDPTELWIRFIGGDIGCTAATATLLTETPEEIAFELVVGITSDALARSCRAGEFNLRVDLALNEDGTGKRISWTQPTEDRPILVTPELALNDFVGLAQDEAIATAQENLIAWRIARIDDEFLPLTDDFNPGRITFQIDDGVVTSAGLG